MKPHTPFTIAASSRALYELTMQLRTCNQVSAIVLKDEIILTPRKQLSVVRSTMATKICFTRS